MREVQTHVRAHVLLVLDVNFGVSRGEHRLQARYQGVAEGRRAGSSRVLNALRFSTCACERGNGMRVASACACTFVLD